MNKTAIVHLNMKFGGVEKQFLYWANNFSDKSRLVLFLCKKEGELLEDLDPAIKVIEIGYYPTLKLDLLWLFKFYKLFVKESCSIIFSLHGTFNWVMPFLKNNKNKVFLSMPGFPQKGRLFQIHRFFLRRVDKVIPVSKNAYKFLQEQWKLDNLLLIENTSGVVKDYGDKVIPPSYNKFTFCTCSRVDNNKNITPILQAVKSLIDLGYDVTYHLIGDGPELPNIRGLVKELGVESKIILHGFVKEPYDLIYQSDLLILNSFSEGVPTVILDAWALYTMVLTSDYFGRDDDFIKDMFNGFVLFDGSVADMVNTIIYIIKLSPSIRQEITQNGYRTYLNNYTLEQYCSAYEKLFN
jgi:glycosyltransferase involved in cell wall biosynthesis